MNSGWKDDKKWSDQFLPEIKQILGLHLIGEPPWEEDAERATDLIVLRMEAVRIGVRIRRPRFFERFPGDLTVRAGRPTGAKTELTKYIEGWGDFFFYGFGDDRTGRLIAWRLGDLNAFRLGLNRGLHRHGRKWLDRRIQRNHDGSSDFAVFGWAEFPQMEIASGGHERAGRRE